MSGSCMSAMPHANCSPFCICDCRQSTCVPLNIHLHCPQARERARAVSSAKRSRALAAQRIAAGQVVAKDDAARVIQSGIRAALGRRQVKREADQELVFIGMQPQVRVCVLTPGALQRLQGAWLMQALQGYGMPASRTSHVRYLGGWGRGCLSSSGRSSGRLTRSWCS